MPTLSVCRLVVTVIVVIITGAVEMSGHNGFAVAAVVGIVWDPVQGRAQ